MADGDITLKIEGERAARLRARAEAAGQSVEEYALGVLGRALEQPGFEETSAPWNGPPVRAPHDNGLEGDNEAYADELDRICDEAERTGGVPWEEFRNRLLNLGSRTR